MFSGEKRDKTSYIARLKRENIAFRGFWGFGRYENRPGPVFVPSEDSKPAKRQVFALESRNVSRFGAFSAQKRDTFVDFNRFFMHPLLIC